MQLCPKLLQDTYKPLTSLSDAGALLLACTNPRIELLGVNLNYPSAYSSLAASSLLGYYNHSHVPIGLTRPFANTTYFDSATYQYGEYASKVAYHWRQYASLTWPDAGQTWDPVALYRRLLSEDEHQKVTIVSLGFLENVSIINVFFEDHGSVTLICMVFFFLFLLALQPAFVRARFILSLIWERVGGVQSLRACDYGRGISLWA